MVFDPYINNRRSIRLKGYDYSRAGAYFVTVCVKDREHLLGKIIDGNMVRNPAGEMVSKIWMQIPENYPEFEIDSFVVMPNHFHGIIIKSDVGVGLPNPNMYKSIWIKGGGTPPLQKQLTLSKIIAYFKYVSTKEINSMQETPGKKLWQRNYYEHIIRNKHELNAYRHYIQDNPENWEEDDYFVKG